MNVNYHKWLELELTNSYFLDAVSTDISIIPTPETSRLLDNYNILLHSRINLFHLFIGVDSASEFSFSESFNGLKTLEFQLLANNNLFFNYTDLPQVFDTELFFFGNTDASEKSTSLSKNQFASSEDIVTLKSKVFDINIESGSNLLEIKDQNEAVIMDIDLSINETPGVQINLNQFNSGLYDIYIDDQFKERIYISNGNLAVNCFGILNINMDTLRDRTEANVNYSINFKARPVFWQYKVIIPESRKIEVLGIEIKGAGDETYSNPVEEPIVGGQTAKVFTSNMVLPLQYTLAEHPQLQLEYTNEFSDRKNEMEISLPNPGAENLRKFNTGEHADAFFSSTIIYV